MALLKQHQGHAAVASQTEQQEQKAFALWQPTGVGLIYCNSYKLKLLHR
jgi:hypothetical protein